MGADVGILDYLGYAVLPNMMKMAQSRQDEIDKQRLGEFINQGRAFETGGQAQAPNPNGMAIEHSGGGAATQEAPEAVRASYERRYGIPMPSGRMRSVDELRLRDAATTGRAGGVQAGEQALMTQAYMPDINNARLSEIDRILGATGERAEDYNITGPLTGVVRNQPRIGELPNSIEAAIARDPNLTLDEKMIKLGELSKLKQRETAAGQPRTIEALIVDLIRSGKSPEEALIIAERLAGARRTETETKEDRRRRQLEQDINARRMKQHSITAGENMLSESMQEKGPLVAQKIDQELQAMIEEYIKLGGNPARLGLPATNAQLQNNDPLGIRGK